MSSQEPSNSSVPSNNTDNDDAPPLRHPPATILGSDTSLAQPSAELLHPQFLQDMIDPHPFFDCDDNPLLDGVMNDDLDSLNIDEHSAWELGLGQTSPTNKRSPSTEISAEVAATPAIPQNLQSSPVFKEIEKLERQLSSDLSPQAEEGLRVESSVGEPVVQTKLIGHTSRRQRLLTEEAVASNFGSSGVESEEGPGERILPEKRLEPEVLACEDTALGNGGGLDGEATSVKSASLKESTATSIDNDIKIPDAVVVNEEGEMMASQMNDDNSHAVMDSSDPAAPLDSSTDSQHCSMEGDGGDGNSGQVVPGDDLTAGGEPMPEEGQLDEVYLGSSQGTGDVGEVQDGTSVASLGSSQMSSDEDEVHGETDSMAMQDTSEEYSDPTVVDASEGVSGIEAGLETDSMQEYSDPTVADASEGFAGIEAGHDIDSMQDRGDEYSDPTVVDASEGVSGIEAGLETDSMQEYSDPTVADAGEGVSGIEAGHDIDSMQDRGDEYSDPTVVDASEDVSGIEAGSETDSMQEYSDPTVADAGEGFAGIEAGHDIDSMQDRGDEYSDPTVVDASEGVSGIEAGLETDSMQEYSDPTVADAGEGVSGIEAGHDIDSMQDRGDEYSDPTVVDASEDVSGIEAGSETDSMQEYSDPTVADAGEGFAGIEAGHDIDSMQDRGDEYNDSTVADESEGVSGIGAGPETDSMQNTANESSDTTVADASEGISGIEVGPETDSMQQNIADEYSDPTVADESEGISGVEAVPDIDPMLDRGEEYSDPTVADASEGVSGIEAGPETDLMQEYSDPTVADASEGVSGFEAGPETDSMQDRGEEYSDPTVADEGEGVSGIEAGPETDSMQDTGEEYSDPTVAYAGEGVCGIEAGPETDSMQDRGDEYSDPTVADEGEGVSGDEADHSDSLPQEWEVLDDAFENEAIGIQGTVDGQSDHAMADECEGVSASDGLSQEWQVLDDAFESEGDSHVASGQHLHEGEDRDKDGGDDSRLTSATKGRISICDPDYCGDDSDEGSMSDESGGALGAVVTQSQGGDSFKVPAVPPSKGRGLLSKSPSGGKTTHTDREDKTLRDVQSIIVNKDQKEDFDEESTETPAVLLCPACKKLLEKPLKLVCSHYICRDRCASRKIMYGFKLYCPICSRISYYHGPLEQEAVDDSMEQRLREHMMGTADSSGEHNKNSVGAQSLGVSASSETTSGFQSTAYTLPKVNSAPVLSTAHVDTTSSLTNPETPPAKEQDIETPKEKQEEPTVDKGLDPSALKMEAESKRLQKEKELCKPKDSKGLNDGPQPGWYGSNSGWSNQGPNQSWGPPPYGGGWGMPPGGFYGPPPMGPMGGPMGPYPPRFRPPGFWNQGPQPWMGYQQPGWPGQGPWGGYQGGPRPGPGPGNQYQTQQSWNTGWNSKHQDNTNSKDPYENLAKSAGAWAQQVGGYNAAVPTTSTSGATTSKTNSNTAPAIGAEYLQYLLLEGVDVPGDRKYIPEWDDYYKQLYDWHIQYGKSYKNQNVSQEKQGKQTRWSSARSSGQTGNYSSAATTGGQQNSSRTSQSTWHSSSANVSSESRTSQASSGPSSVNSTTSSSASSSASSSSASSSASSSSSSVNPPAPGSNPVLITANTSEVVAQTSESSVALSRRVMTVRPFMGPQTTNQDGSEQQTSALTTQGIPLPAASSIAPPGVEVGNQESAGGDVRGLKRKITDSMAAESLPKKGETVHGLSQQGVWVSFWTLKPLKSNSRDTQTFL